MANAQCAFRVGVARDLRVNWEMASTGKNPGTVTVAADVIGDVADLMLS